MNKIALVTGASSGIGLEFAKILAANDYDLILVARNKSELDKVAKTLPTTTTTVAVDLSTKGSADHVWKYVKGDIDFVINNAGFGDLEDIDKADWKKLEAMIDLNIETLTRLSQLASIKMKKQGSGHILNVASTAAFAPGPRMATYYATKAYVLSFTEAIAEELKGTGVTVTALCPGPTQSNFAKQANASRSGIFSGKLPTAHDVALYGYLSAMKGKVVAVHGLKNKLSALVLPRLVSRALLRRAVERAQS
ncbi:MAG: SDR family oxidoreductase [bacterium]|nr:SDR family oxidoreductase [bacterium]